MQPFYYSVYMLLLHTALITDVIQMIFTCLSTIQCKITLVILIYTVNKNNRVDVLCFNMLVNHNKTWKKCL